jgi:phage terminase large subunit
MQLKKNMNDVLRLKKTWFNPLYFHLRKYVEDNKIRRVMIYGGKSSAKTFTIAQLFNVISYTNNVSCIAYRKEQTTIKISLKPAFVKAIDSIHMNAVYNVQDFAIKGNNSQIIVFKGIDSEGKIKGIEGFKYILLDELDHYSEEEFMQANLSLRGMQGQKIFATWNPVDENIWIKKYIDRLQWDELPLTIKGNKQATLDATAFVRKSKDGKTLLIKTTYFDNKWIVGANGYGSRDQNLIDEYEMLKIIDPNSYNVNVLGEWGVRDKSNKFAFAFEQSKHVGSVEYNPDYLIWLSFDFNVNPISCTAFQYYDDVLRAIKCFKLDNSNIYELCKLIASYFPDAMFKVTGDASGTSRSAMVADNVNYYTIIKDELGLIWSQFNIPSVNPRIEENQVKVNAVLYAGLFVADSENCKELIYDLTYVEVDENKKIIKDRTAESKKSDFLDHFRYICNIIWPNIKLIKPVKK